MTDPSVPNKRPLWLWTTLLLIFLLFTSALVSWVSAAPGSSATDETNLNPAGEVYEINRDSQGMLYVSDYAAGEIWKINPVDDGYTLFGNLGEALDAQPDANGKIWFTDDVDSIAVLDPATHQGTRWTLGNSELSLQAITFDQAGYVWIAEGFGQTSKLNRFNPTTYEWCPYSLPGGSYAYDLIYADGFLWQTNWGNDRVFKFDPVSEQLLRWNIGTDATPKGLALDSDNNLWWADAKLAALVRFDTDTNQMTKYSLPFGSKPVMLHFNDNALWYTEDSSGSPNPPGTFGSLNPGQASGTMTTLSPATQSLTHDACTNLGAGSPFTASVSSGKLAWNTGMATQVVNQSGWMIYQLPDQSIPYGISSTAGMVWVADQGRQKLVRFPLDYYLYLPLVHQN
jgi:streptogramin lyase